MTLYPYKMTKICTLHFLFKYLIKQIWFIYRIKKNWLFLIDIYWTVYPVFRRKKTKTLEICYSIIKNILYTKSSFIFLLFFFPSIQMSSIFSFCFWMIYFYHSCKKWYIIKRFYPFSLFFFIDLDYMSFDMDAERIEYMSFTVAFIITKTLVKYILNSCQTSN